MSDLMTPAKNKIKRRHEPLLPVEMNNVAAIILSGGQGTRLYPLTETRCKPAICFGGHYRLIDVPISNALHSGCSKLFIITQFLASSLHRHIYSTYRHDKLSPGFIEVLTAEERPGKNGWFQGTADAVRQNLLYLNEISADYFLILSGDQLYHLDFQKMVAFAKKTDADLVIASIKVKQHAASRLGILKKNSKHFISRFIEKPQKVEELKPFELEEDEELKSFEREENKEPSYLASMGIYLFKRKALFDLLNEDSRHDFGKHLIPTMVKRKKAACYIHDGYWEDIGTISSFYHANISLTKAHSFFDCYDANRPIFTNSFNLPGAKITAESISSSIICEGSIIHAKAVKNSILGPRTVVGKGTVIEESYLMGNDYYDPPAQIEHGPKHLRIGENCIIKKAIIDKNVSIGDRVQLINAEQLQHHDCAPVLIRDGIIIVPRGSIIPDDFKL